MIFKKVTSVEKIKTADNFVYCLEVGTNHNFNVNGINVGNCRLRNGLAKANAKDKEYSNSFGVGRYFNSVHTAQLP